MRTIQKGREPASLTQYRKQPDADYDNYTDKDTLRQAIVAEQRAVCCYCQSRIRSVWNKIKIEHWQCQATYPERQLDYANLLGACMGGHGRPKREQHCDTHKGNEDLCFSVCDAAHPVERQIRFLGNGEMVADDAAINSELNEVLNLNLPRLVSNRKAVLSAFQQRLQSGYPVDPLRELPNWDGSQPGELPEYAQIVVYWLVKKQRRAAA